MTDSAPLKTPGRRPPSLTPPSFPTLIVLAVAFGLCGGYLDVGLIVFKKLFWNEEGYYRNAADFPWTVPVGHAILTLMLGLVVVVLGRLRPKPVSLRAASWSFATLAIWGALLRLPLYGVCSLVLAMGLARPISHVVNHEIGVHGLRSRRVGTSLAAIFGMVFILAGLSSGLQLLREYRTISSLPPTSPTARNVILIVWDTVRAYNTTLSGYHRDTTPNLARWAKKGVTYKQAVSPAPWTYPAHCSFLTGQWPCQLNSQWKLTLDTPNPTLAEYLTSRGYQTAGFVANTNCCSYESGLARGFTHYEDYALAPELILTRTVPGNWISRYFCFSGITTRKNGSTSSRAELVRSTRLSLAG